MARKKKSEREDLFHLDELFLEPFPVGILAHELIRHLDLLQVLCFRDNEYGGVADVAHILDRVVRRQIGRRLARSRKSVILQDLSPLKDEYHQMVASFVADGVPGTFTFSLFPVSRRKRAAARNKSSEAQGLSKPRRGAIRPPKRKRKK